jgi:tryptophan-rich sensory protein
LKRKNWKVYAFWIGLSLGVGALSGLLSRPGMEGFQETVAQPPLSPPAILFPIVWTLLYTLMGISAARIWLTEPSELRSRSINLFIAQLVVNFFWSLIFFDARSFPLAFLWLLLLWGLVAWMIITFRKIDSRAALLQVPYLLWLTFAAYLSAGVWVLNA